jgi:phosphoenolpyruvate synthase/pyruvate phosphate dikinase
MVGAAHEYPPEVAWIRLPMLGWRRACRYISQWYEKVFRLECKAMFRKPK